MRDRFAKAGIASAPLDARLLAEKAFAIDGLLLITSENDKASPDQIEALEALAIRRLTGEPVARIMGTKEFYGLEFALNAATLVPRPETELLVELGLQSVKDCASPSVLDLGTGSGCIPIALLVNCGNAVAVAVDLSAQALEQARANGARHGVSNRMDLHQGSWFEPLRIDSRFDLIVSNPPYIESHAIDQLDREVRLHDPTLALDGGVDGLEPYRVIAAHSQQHLLPGGVVIVEVGFGQAEMVAKMFIAAGFKQSLAHDDLAGKARAVLSVI